MNDKPTVEELRTYGIQYEHPHMNAYRLDDQDWEICEEEGFTPYVVHWIQL